MTVEHVIDLSARIRSGLVSDLAALTEAVKEINTSKTFNDLHWAIVFANNASTTLQSELNKLEHATTKQWNPL